MAIDQRQFADDEGIEHSLLVAAFPRLDYLKPGTNWSPPSKRELVGVGRESSLPNLA